MAARDPHIHLLASKLVPPTQTRALLLRTSLVAGLRPMLQKQVVLLSAPAGYGKTTLLTQLFETLRCDGRHVAWISIDAADNDFVRFTAHCLGALRTISPEAVVGIVDPLAHGAASRRGMESGPQDDALIGELLTIFANWPHETWLFLDDIHLLTSTAAHRFVAALMNAPHTQVHLVIASRDRSPWALGRLRARDQLHEIDAIQLMFNAAESMQVIADACGKSLSETQMATLHARTEGWPASVRLAAIALREAADVDAFLARFSGADCSVADFLVEEVLAQQAPDLQDFLVATSLLKRFNSELANEMLGIGNARELIDRLQFLNLFVFALDRERQWYRYHHLFADLLRQRITDRQPQRVTTLHRRAGAWLAAHGHPIEAIEHALAAGDTSNAGVWLDRASPALFASGQTTTLQTLASRLPPEELATLPRLQLELVWEDMIRWRFDRARRALSALVPRLSTIGSSAVQREAALEDDPLRTRLAHRELMLQVFTDQLESAELASKSWPPKGDPPDPFENASVATALIMCRREQFDCELAHAQWAALRRQYIDAGATYGTVFLDTVVGGTLFMRGELTDAATVFSTGRSTAIAIQGADSALTMMPTVHLAAVRYETNQIAEARELLRDADALAPDFGLVDSAIAHRITCARIARAQADYVGAHRALDAATYTADRFELPRLHAHVLAERVRLLIDEGMIRDAARLLSGERYGGEGRGRLQGGPFDVTHARLVVAHVRVATEMGELEDAQSLLRHWLTWMRRREARLPTIELLVLLARVQLRVGDRVGAQRTLVDALKLASHGPVLRTIVDEGPEVGALIGDFIPAIRDTGLLPPPYVGSLLAAYGPTESTPHGPIATDTSEVTATALSTRELDILRLAAANLSSQEAARALGLSESTIKWYWQCIFDKTGVRRKSLAIRVARERGLIG